MKPQSHICLIVFTLFLLLCPLGCANSKNSESNSFHPNVSDAVSGVLQEKEAALRQNDWPRYLSTLSQTGLHPTYATEQRTWFSDAAVCGLTHYSLRLVRIESCEQNVCHAVVEQSYRYQEKTERCEIPMIFSIEQSDQGYRAKDLGYDFLSMKNDVAIVYYTAKDEYAAQAVLSAAQRQYARLQELFPDCSLGTICINFYPSQQQMRASIKPSVPSWTGGWTEPAESIKLYYDPAQPKQDYNVVLAHELAHLYTFSLCQDHAAYWLIEGLAGLLEQSPPQMTDSDIMLLQFAKDAQFPLDFDTLSQIDYESLTDHYLAGSYYAACKLAANQLFEEYGIDGIISLLSALGQQRVLSDRYGPERIEETSRLTRSCMQEVGMDPDVFASKYNARLNQIQKE